MVYKTISEIKEANRRAGFFWFDESCRAETPIRGGSYWVESRPRHDSEISTSGSRWYAPVVALDDGSVDWVDNTATRLETFAEAKAMLDNAVAAAQTADS